jgi:hypothetical protein
MRRKITNAVGTEFAVISPYSAGLTFIRRSEHGRDAQCVGKRAIELSNLGRAKRS